MEVNVSSLRAHLSAYLGRVRKGETVTVLDRKTPVARIVPIEPRRTGLVVTPASASPSVIGKVRGVRLDPPIDVLALLGEMRGER